MPVSNKETEVLKLSISEGCEWISRNVTYSLCVPSKKALRSYAQQVWQLGCRVGVLVSHMRLGI